MADHKAVPLRSIGVERSFIGGDGGAIDVLTGVDVAVDCGEMVAIIGASGAGKSTLLHLLGGLDRPTAGRVEVAGTPLDALSDDELSRVRNRDIGFVFQFHHLLRGFTALDNVMMPSLISGTQPARARKMARDLLVEVGLELRGKHTPNQLSGGEQQRVAVARALINEPTVLLADEPSGNLDIAASSRLHGLLNDIRAQRDLAVVVATHNMELAMAADRVLTLRGGELLVPEGGKEAVLAHPIGPGLKREPTG